MTSVPDAEVIDLPVRPSGDGRRARVNAQNAATRPRVREDTTIQADAGPAPERRSFTLRMPSLPASWTVSGVLTGGSLIATAAPAVLTVWASHQQASNYYRHWFTRCPRLAYGAAHAFIEVPFLYLWAWSGHSPVLRVLVVATILAILRFGLGVHVIWSWL
jgi:hypothetical protein